MSKAGANGSGATPYSGVRVATGVRGTALTVATATKPDAQAPHALDAAPCEGRFDDPCPALSAFRQSTGHRPASRVTKSATSRMPTRASFVKTENLRQRSYIRF